jgi:hypothetical protein
MRRTILRAAACVAGVLVVLVAASIAFVASGVPRDVGAAIMTVIGLPIGVIGMAIFLHWNGHARFGGRG